MEPDDGVRRAPVSLTERGERSILLRVRPFRDQEQLLAFAARLERLPGISNVALVRGALDDAWFSLLSPSRAVVVEALERLDGFNLTAVPIGGAVEVRFMDRDPASGQASASGEEAPLLPRRRRYRLFRPEDEPVHDLDQRATTAGSPSPSALDSVTSSSRPERSGPHSGMLPPPTDPSPSSTPVESEHWLITPLRIIRDAAPRLRRRRRAPGGRGVPTTAYTLICAPFPSIEAVNQFQDALLRIPGVADARLRQFQSGMLQLTVEYEDEAPDVPPLAQRLVHLESWRIRLISQSDREIQVELVDQIKT